MLPSRSPTRIQSTGCGGIYHTLLYIQSVKLRHVRFHGKVLAIEEGIVMGNAYEEELQFVTFNGLYEKHHLHLSS
jgi:hypothetical protein